MSVVNLASSSYKGTALKFFIPTIYALTPNKVYIISPWLNINVNLVIPWERNQPEISFNSLILEYRTIGVDTIFFISSLSNGNRTTIDSKKLLIDEGFQVSEIEDLHSKVILGKYLKIIGSSNITENGLFNFKENFVVLQIDGSAEEEVRKLIT